MSDGHASREPTIEVRSPQPHAVLVVLGGEHDLARLRSFGRPSISPSAAAIT